MSSIYIYLSSSIYKYQCPKCKQQKISNTGGKSILKFVFQVKSITFSYFKNDF